MVDRVCEICGAEFTIPPAWVRKGGGRCCSRKCLGQLNKRERSGPDSPHWKADRSNLFDQNAYNKKYYEEHRDEEIVYSRNYREAHKEEIAAKKKVYNKEHRDEIITHNKKYYRENTAKVRAINDAWRERNREWYTTYMKQYQSDHREELSIYWSEYRQMNLEREREQDRAYSKSPAGRARDAKKHHRRRAAKAGTESSVSHAFLMALKGVPMVECYWCGRAVPGDRATVEHIVPLLPREGEPQGSDTEDNVVAACGRCNGQKGNLQPGDFVRRQVALGRRVAPWHTW